MYSKGKICDNSSYLLDAISARRAYITEKAADTILKLINSIIHCTELQ